MPAISAKAPGKIILFGEHAVVYGQPAIAAPVSQVYARALVTPEPRLQPGAIHIQAPDIDLDCYLADLAPDHPLAIMLNEILRRLAIKDSPAFTLRLSSSIPVAAGLGSGAAVSVAIARAVPAFLGRPFTDEQVSALAYEVEKSYHGSPSGIDNTVIAYRQPVYFIRGEPIELLHVPRPFILVIGDSGIRRPTVIAVSDLRARWQADPKFYDSLFKQVGRIAQAARGLIEAGQPALLGPLMDDNQTLLAAMGVSSPELECLVGAARQAGARGAKLSGAGLGGNMLALVEPESASIVAAALLEAGAARTIITRVGRAKQELANAS